MTARKRPPRCCRARLLSLVALTAGCFATTPGARAQETSASPMVEELQRMIQERDAVILDLLRRIERLERMTGAAPALPPAAAPVPVATAPPPPNTVPGVPAAGPEEEPDAVAQQAPGAFEVDEDTAERALERTLVETGALLLPFGQAEVEPSLRFERTERDAPTVVVQDGPPGLLGEQEARRNELTGALELRAGLPGDAQLELDLPYRYVEQSLVATGGGFEAIERDNTGTGFGDLSVGLAKTLLRERGYWPDLIARVRWDTAIGEEDDGGVALGGGFNELSGSLVATKRQDPLVFVGSLSYETAFENDGIDPGDELGFVLGAVLAASPETSLRFVLNQRLVDEVEVDGRSIAGSDQVASTLFLGASSIVGPGVLLDVQAGVGVSEDAPDYSIRVGLPIRFNLPFGGYTALAGSRGQEEQVGSGGTSRRPSNGEEELTAARARVRDDLARELGGTTHAPAGIDAGGPEQSQQARADGTRSAQALERKAGAPPEEADTVTPAVEHSPGPCDGRIEVGSGDTLFGIARRCKTTVDALMKANPEINDPTLVRIGQPIQIPTGAGEASRQQATAPAPAASPQQPAASGPDAAWPEQAGAERDAQVALMKAQAAVRTAREREPQQEAVTTAEEPRSAAAPAGAGAPGPCAGSIEVESGDTLFGIAVRRCKTTVEALMQANPEIKDPTLIRVGQKIALPAR